MFQHHFSSNQNCHFSSSFLFWSFILFRAEAQIVKMQSLRICFFDLVFKNLGSILNRMVHFAFSLSAQLAQQCSFGMERDKFIWAALPDPCNGKGYCQIASANTKKWKEPLAIWFNDGKLNSSFEIQKELLQWQFLPSIYSISNLSGFTYPKLT